MTFVDTNVFVYAVGGRHPIRQSARDFFEKSVETSTQLYTSAEVVQELLHVFLPVHRIQEFEAAIGIIRNLRITVWPLEHEDVILARELHEQHPSLSARDLCHFASCRRRGVRRIKTFDQALLGVSL